MGDRDWAWIGLALVSLAAASILTSRMLKLHSDLIVAHDEDISMIKAVLKTMDGAGQ